MQLDLWSADAERPLAERLRGLGLPPVPRIQLHRNRTVMVSWKPGAVLRLHEGYSHAPDPVLKALVRFVTPGIRREARLCARKIFLSFPVEAFAPPPPARLGPGERARPGDRLLLKRLAEVQAEFNRQHFGGRLPPLPIRLSDRMRRRLGEIRLDPGGGPPLMITLSRRHIRRDDWSMVRDTLLHEMIHQWQAESGLPVDHGRAFRRKAREVGVDPRAVIRIDSVR
jgi:SprT-like family